MVSCIQDLDKFATKELLLVVGLVINIIVGLALVLWGSLVMKQSSLTKGFMDWVQEKANHFAGGEYCVPFYVVALGFIVLGLFALFNATMIIAEHYGFWIV